MPHRVIKTEADLRDLGKLLATLDRPFTVEYRKGRDRSLDQNALMWKWAGEVAQQREDVSADDTQRRWKLEIGVPILRSENAGFRAFYDEALKGHTYETKLAAMKYVPVTSTMTVPQMKAFMDTIQRECAEQGIRLTDPEANG